VVVPEDQAHEPVAQSAESVKVDEHGVSYCGRGAVPGGVR
jgi:hypothetical protein